MNWYPLLTSDLNGDMALHDWGEHNPYVYFATERSESAKKSALARWQKKNDLETPSYANRIRPAYDSYAPSPSPSPSPNIKDDIEKCMSIIQSIPAYPFDAEKDTQFIIEKIQQFPHIDPISLLENWKAYILDHPFKENSSPHSQLHNQFKLARKYNKHKRIRTEPDTIDPIDRAIQRMQGVQE
ncbi:MAG: hypothetical protein M0Z64_07520 [Nitrospiraceae bacterium]|nr:hypothetical protein [Nitrospiraceae bacterium]